LPSEPVDVVRKKAPGPLPARSRWDIEFLSNLVKNSRDFLGKIYQNTDVAALFSSIRPQKFLTERAIIRAETVYA
jgi:hypothetical protein